MPVLDQVIGASAWAALALLIFLVVRYKIRHRRALKVAKLSELERLQYDVFRAKGATGSLALQRVLSLRQLAEVQDLMTNSSRENELRAVAAYMTQQREEGR